MNTDLFIDGDDQPVVAMADILEVFKSFSDTKTMAQIKQAVVDKYTGQNQLMNPHDIFIRNEVDRLIKEDRKLGNGSDLVYTKTKKYQKRKNKPGISKPISKPRYLGTAGEVAVMAELLFNDYNVNRMILDEGLDLVATKDSRVYFIQVKTTCVELGNNMDWQIPVAPYDLNKESNIRYVFVARYSKNGKNENMFFILQPSIIDAMIAGQCIKRTDANVCIKIKLDPKTGDAILYDNKEFPAEQFRNNFDL